MYECSGWIAKLGLPDQRGRSRSGRSAQARYRRAIGCARLAPLHAAHSAIALLDKLSASYRNSVPSSTEDGGRRTEDGLIRLPSSVFRPEKTRIGFRVACT